MKKIIRLLAISYIIILGCSGTPALAAMSITPQPPITTTTPDIIATSIVAGAQLEHIELFNQTDVPIHLTGWQLAATSKGTGSCQVQQTVTQSLETNQWILPKHYFTFTPSQTLPAACAELTSIQLFQGKTLVQHIAVSDSTTLTTDKVYQHKQRANSPTSARNASGSFEADYTKIVAANQSSLYSDPLYTPQASNAGLQILEILPNARSCSPANSDPSCGDFIKFYNPTDKPINLAGYRLRIGHKGQTTSNTNTFTWGSELDPGANELLLPPHSFFTLTTRNDGQSLNIADGGGFVWLEDAYGILAYEPVIEYPDASSTAKTGQSWALDGTSWQWSTAPQPNQPNYFPPEPTTGNPSVTIKSSLKPCTGNQYRSPETNRCHNVAATASTVTPCKEGQERNPDTNRCRSVVAGGAEPKPCEPGEERNIQTNRCRKIPASGSGHVQGATDKNEAANQFTWVVALAAVIAICYGAYEWRHDIALGFSRIKSKFVNLVTRSKH